MEIQYSIDAQKEIMENAGEILRKEFSQEESIALIKAMLLMSWVKTNPYNLFVKK